MKENPWHYGEATPFSLPTVPTMTYMNIFKMSSIVMLLALTHTFKSSDYMIMEQSELFPNMGVVSGKQRHTFFKKISFNCDYSLLP